MPTRLSQLTSTTQMRASHCGSRGGRTCPQNHGVCTTHANTKNAAPLPTRVITLYMSAPHHPPSHISAP
jgi:hypothetical protein